MAVIAMADETRRSTKKSVEMQVSTKWIVVIKHRNKENECNTKIKSIGEKEDM